MNKGLIAINGVLVVAVAVLFYLQFSKPTPSVVNSVNNTSADVQTNNSGVVDSLNQFLSLDSNIMAKPIKIAYVDNDSLDKNLKMLRDIEAEVMKKEEELAEKIKAEKGKYEARFTRKVQAYEKRSKAYPLKAPSMTDAQLKKEQEYLQSEPQVIGQLEQQYQQQLMQFQSVLEQEYLKLKQERMLAYYEKVQGYCNSIADQLGFDFILSYQNGGQILHANKAYDISKYVVDAINKEYDAANANKTTETAK